MCGFSQYIKIKLNIPRKEKGPKREEELDKTEDKPQLTHGKVVRNPQ